MTSGIPVIKIAATSSVCRSQREARGTGGRSETSTKAYLPNHQWLLGLLLAISLAPRD